MCVGKGLYEFSMVMPELAGWLAGLVACTQLNKEP